jgi:DNA-binding MarR family transcriptional regulator
MPRRSVPATSAASLDLVATVMATADAFLRESQRLFRPHGLTGAQYNVLNVLAATAEGISQRELGDALVVDRSNVTGLLNRLEAAGWVRRTDHPDDRRIYRVSLTPAGRRLWKKIQPRYAMVVAEVTRGLSAKRMAECRGVLEHLAEAAATWQLPPRQFP